jgi:hypothetical protein
MEEQQVSTKHAIRSRWNSDTVLFECKVPADIESGLRTRYVLERAVEDRAVLSGADLSGAVLRGAVLSGAVLREFKADFFDVLLRAPREIAGLREALIAGRVDGSTYEGECACLVGTIANVRGASYDSLGNGISPNAGRPIEQWFMSIRKGDTPETNQCSKLAVEWIDDFVSLLAAASAGVA